MQHLPGPAPLRPRIPSGCFGHYLLSVRVLIFCSPNSVGTASFCPADSATLATFSASLDALAGDPFVCARYLAAPVATSLIARPPLSAAHL